MSLLGAPWPVMIVAAIQAACGIGTKGIDDEKAVEIGRHLFFRAMQTLLSNYSNDSSHVATPGGITERGLNHIGELTNHFESAFAAVRTRAKELSV